MKRFKSKKANNKKGVIIFIILFFSSYLLMKNLFLKNINEEKFKIVSNNSTFTFETIKDPNFIIKYSLGNIEKTNDELKKESEVVSMVKNDDPIVYFYNTHDTEKYSYKAYEAFNVNPTVITASYILKEYLKEEGITSLVEVNTASKILNENNWKYGKSYKASRILLENAYLNNNTLKYFFDIHRDSSNYEATTIEIEGIKYARLLFVVGLENENYEQNLLLAENLNAKLKDINPNLTRGIMKKSGKGVNGVYNQDFNQNTMLIEVGGQYNSIDEVNNTLKYLAKVIASYIGENNGN